MCLLNGVKFGNWKYALHLLARIRIIGRVPSAEAFNAAMVGRGVCLLRVVRSLEEGAATPSIFLNPSQSPTEVRLSKKISKTVSETVEL